MTKRTYVIRGGELVEKEDLKRMKADPVYFIETAGMGDIYTHQKAMLERIGQAFGPQYYPGLRFVRSHKTPYDLYIEEIVALGLERMRDEGRIPEWSEGIKKP